MPYLAGGVLVAIAMTLLNLLLVLGVIRRLREHTKLLTTRNMPGPDLMVGVGESPERFTATTTDGEQISLETLGGEQLVGFFSPHCEPCKEKAPLFAERAALGGRGSALAVVIGSPDDASELVTLFEPVAKVVIEPTLDGGSLGPAFKVKGFPALCALGHDGVVTATGPNLLQEERIRKSPSLVS